LSFDRGASYHPSVSTVFSAFEQTARAHPAKAFLQTFPEKARLTYGEALDEIARIAARYRAAGYGPGHRVALQLPNCPQFLPHFLALNSLGAAVVPLNPDYRPAERDYVLEHSEASAVITKDFLQEPPRPPSSTPRAPPASPRGACSATSTSSTPGGATSRKAACARCATAKNGSSRPCRSST
jgi:acyl-coenzyme A synthetase/AMP-(fatty) acid ligase